MAVNNIAQMFDDEQVKHLDMKKKGKKHHRLGELDVVRQPVNFSEYEQPKELKYAAPDLGQHNEDILREFGFDDEFIKDLVEKKCGIIFKSNYFKKLTNEIKYRENHCQKRWQNWMDDHQ